MRLQHGLALCASLDRVALAASNFKTTCLEFQPENFIYNSTLRLLEYVTSGTNLTFPGNDASCARSSQVVSTELCRIALSIPTSNRSSIVFELWLPQQWTGQFLATGNGGIDGCIKYEDMAYTIYYGFATTGSNNSHNGTSGFAFYHDPDVVTDFVWRSLHTTATAGKELIKHFYGKPYSKSYYLGCSQGGRQGAKAAEMFPGDYDGVVAGCPAVNFNYISSWRASFYPITGPSNASDFIQPFTWTGLSHREILRQCDGIDGVLDGILEDSDLPLYGEQGQLIYPGLQHGGEVMAVSGLLAGKPFSYSSDWFKYVVYSNPGWDALTWTIHDATVAEALNPPSIWTWPESLSHFRDRGGKLIVYHGGQDNQITALNTERFYNHLSVGMGSPAACLDE
ncbi:tannase and feruloyl esterase [Lepidopterella palustris CBS 459.81]|uniref:Carboxylic ester hydrolase n=1 Tax=Lepidopterella palustris CBS 459.81 TaxID=1314670 RepID=A0A8E2EJ60_9PEZI|nr:tannase and feruloyl esterase [Lepidopterella palustris CBS 459.81]